MTAGKFENEHITAYRVTENGPCTDEQMALHDEFVEWLHASPLSWEGDEWGICFYGLGHTAGENPGGMFEVLAAPGDWVVNIRHGNQWLVVPAAAWPGLRLLTTTMSEV